MHISAIAILAGASALGLVSPVVHASKNCPPITGDFNVTYFRLYTESFDYDFINCKAYFGCVVTELYSGSWPSYQITYILS